jgi:fatty acid desaturase
MKYWKWLNLMPLLLFIIRDVLGMAGINPIWMLVAVALAIMNIKMAKSMMEYLLASLLLLLSCVGGMILNTYYYYYFISSDSETPIVGAFAVIVYGILVIVLTVVGAVVLAIRDHKKQHE